jgi:hypothetical protein
VCGIGILLSRGEDATGRGLATVHDHAPFGVNLFILTPSMGEGFFREEALRHHMGARVSGDLLRVPPSWTRWTFAFLLAVFAAAAVYAALGSITVYTHGLAVIRGASAGAPSVTVYFPERDRSRLTEGLAVRIENPENPRRAHRARLVSVVANPVPLAVALQELGIAAWPHASPPSRLASASARLENDRPTTATADEILDADAPIGEESLLALLVPALRSARED